MGIVLLIALCIACLIWYAAIREDRHGLLTVTFLNIGQGDSIFIDAPSGRQVLIDGGPDSSVLRQLSAVMPWYDRSIDVMIPTHPDADHISGLIDVLAHYQIGLILQSSVLGSTATWHTLEKDISQEGAQIVTGQRGEIIDLGKGAYLEVLSPDRPLPNAETNTACVVTRLVYGNTSFMLSCDAPKEIENYLVRLDGKALRSDVLKAGHHGSKNSSSPLFVGYVDPTYAVYSRGCDNKYGHPNQETIDTLAKFNIPTLDTCKDGAITFVSDGETVKRR
ncbi:MAG: Metallo-beta-lactamase family protein [Candidatus Kaiserbacteria bacterium]|nr:Metallo-beta-lactamase family protein [Candidatus Kaiserbacteria bacterium]